MLSVYLDGQLFDEPIGLDALQDRIFYNDELAMYLNQLDGDVQFIGDGYNYLRGIFKDNICTKVDVEIKNDKTFESWEGVIFINDIDWNISKRIATCKIITDKYIELIDNNKGIEVQMGVNLSKDQETIIVDPAVTISVPNPTSTVFINRIGYRVFDVFEALIRFMSNEELTFVSDYFDPVNGGDASYDVIMYGEELRLGAGNLTPLISYQDFFSDMNKLHNLAGAIEGDTLRIEPKEYFRTNQISATIQDINEVEQSLNKEQFYSSVKMGSAKVADDFNYLIRLSYNGFQKEQFFLQGQCNIYNELDLELRTLVTDTNVIQDMLPVSSSGSNNSDFDDDIILLNCSQANIVRLTQAPITGTFYFNDYYTNREISERWSGEYPFSIVQLLETEEPLVWANLTSNQTPTTSPSIPYFSPDDDSTPPFFDNGSNYSIGTIPLTPFFSDNVAYFQAPSDMIVSISIDFFITGNYADTVINIVDSSGNGTGTGGGLVDMNPNIGFNQIFSYVTQYRILGSVTAYMPSGSRAYVACRMGSDGTFFAGGQIRINQLGTFGGVYKVVNSNQTYVSRTDFEYPIDVDSWAEIKADPFKKVDCSYVDGSFTGYPLDIRRNILTGESDVQLYQRKIDFNG
jgi:hypothetical protein